MTNLADLFRKSTPEESSSRMGVEDSINYLSSKYGPGYSQEWIKGTWKLEFDYTSTIAAAKSLYGGFECSDKERTSKCNAPTPTINDLPSMESGRIVVNRIINGKAYARSLTPQELIDLGYRKVANAWFSSERNRSLPEEFHIVGLPFKVVTYGCDEFGNFMLGYLSHWELQK